MVKFILVRHGQTDWNKSEIFRGLANVPLNGVGIKQAQAVAEVLKGEKIDAVIASPLQRATKTAQIIAKPHQLEVIPDEGFIDIDYGQWQGLSHSEVKEKYPFIYQQWIEDPQKAKIPLGESLKAVRIRCLKTMREIIPSKLTKTVVIVSHRVINKVLLCACLGLSNAHFWQIKQDPCSINRFHYTNRKFTFTLLNDTCHLKNIADGEVRDF